MTIQKILKAANEIAALKRSLGMDAAPWEMSDCLRIACQDAASVRGDGDKMTVRPYAGGLYTYPVSVSPDGKRWEQGWI